PPCDSKNDDPTHTDHARTFQLFGNSPSMTSPNPSLKLKPPASPLPERHPTILDADAPTFVPQESVTRFDPFNAQGDSNSHSDSNDYNKQSHHYDIDIDDDDDDDVVLSNHLLNAQLLDDFDVDDNSTTPSSSTIHATPSHLPITTTTPSVTNSSTTSVGINTILPTTTTATVLSPWNGSNTSWKPGLESTMKNIWENDNNNKNNSNSYNNSGEEWWDRFEPYSQEDEKEFDPTLQYYHGSLIDTDTIQDMSKLSLTDPSIEESQVENIGEDMSAIQMLESIFTDLSEAELTSTLEENEYDLDKTTESLFDRKQQQTVLTSPQQQEQYVSSSSAPPKKRQVCRHFLAGECYRKDCWFAHDLQVKVCKFWLQGSCLKGDYCEFSHHIDVNEVANKMNIQKNQPITKPARFDESEYPGLQSQKKSTTKATPITMKKTFLSSTSIDNNILPSSKTSVTVEKKQLEDDDFPSLAASAKMRTTTSPSTSSSDISKCTKPVNFAEIAKRKAQSNSKSIGSATKKRGVPLMSESRIMQRLKKPVNIPWLVTGSTLNTEYLKQREQAIQYGTLRNRFFSRATAFYLQGDGAKAKAYSNEAKYYNRLMQEMHTEASRRIFEQRNQHEAFIDLHGLHTDEALDMIEERLDNLKNSYQGVVYIITGTGHHSGAHSSKNSKLKPSVDEFLREQGYRFAETNMVGDNKGGIFAVDLTLYHHQRS
ncbi:hypothetical protein INT45_004967, partial [Circinella minor]